MSTHRCLLYISILTLLSMPSNWTLSALAQEKTSTIQLPKSRLLEDWLLQDTENSPIDSIFTSKEDAKREQQLVTKVLDELNRDWDNEAKGEEPKELKNTDEQIANLQKRFTSLCEQAKPGVDPTWKELYSDACMLRRQRRLATLIETYPKIVFTKHYNLGGSHYAYTSNVTDAQLAERERHNLDYRMGSSLCTLQLTPDGQVTLETLLHEPNGVIRDPEVSYDGKRILFAMRHSADKDDYHLYEMNLENHQTRQLTFGDGYADHEAIYLPSGDILFNSTRCTQIVDCWYTPVTNLYACDKDGKLIRRVSIDQVHTNYPKLLNDGRVVYTRWDYNDRGQLFPQPLFVMNADGTNQRELYGNNSWFPTTLLHARPIPGTHKLIAIATGHHTHQRGKLAIVDSTQGTQENAGITFLAPEHKPEAVRIDQYGQDGAQFQYPFPINQHEFIVAMNPIGGPLRKYDRSYGIYWVDQTGQRELLAFDATISCNQPIPLATRPCPPARATAVDYQKREGVYYMQDVYVGPGLKGIKRGAVKKLRVVAIDFRTAWVGTNYNGGASGGAFVSTPISIGNGTWDVKRVLGEATVYEDGSACFSVPAMTPVYFQALDENRHVVQTMRSWSTLQPGEKMSCVGCHEDKNQTAGNFQVTTAMHKGPQELEAFYGPARSFSFAREIQPILDKHCIECHQNRQALFARLDGTSQNQPKPQASTTEIKPFSLTGELYTDQRAKRKWSHGYLALTQAKHAPQNPPTEKPTLIAQPTELVHWLDVQSVPTLLPPYQSGAAKSRLITMLREGHNEVQLSKEELDKIACWIDLLVPYCGDYRESNAWSPSDLEMYDYHQAKRDAMEQMSRKSMDTLAQQQKSAGQ